MDPSVFYVKPNQLHEYWPKIRPELDELIERNGYDWIPEDVYTDCRTNVSFIYVVAVEGVECGFFILTPQPDGSLLVFAVCMFQNTPLALRRRTMLEGVCYIRQLAIQLKYQRITAYSRRRGAARLFKRYGFHTVETKFEMSI